MAYKYFTSSSPIRFQSTGCYILNEFQEYVNTQFYNAPDAFVIQEEYPAASGSYINIDVRINRGISTYTGAKLGDDFKNIMFKDLAHATAVGVKYLFDNNYWLVINSEIIKNFAAGCTIRRCNNVLRWKDNNGVLYSEPCVIDYEISRPRDEMRINNPVMPAGYMKIYAQLNNKTKKIRGNQRFLFGPVENRICMKVFGDGVRNFLNQQTLDDSSPSLLELQVGGNYVNANTDDITLGIADAYLDYGDLTSGSNIGILDVIVTPSVNYLFQSGSSNYDVRYYSGSNVLSGSFVFSVSGSFVPTDKYVFAQLTENTFYLYNIRSYMDHTLDILCSGSSGSRILNFELRGGW
jgi:hypothetical protein